MVCILSHPQVASNAIAQKRSPRNLRKFNIIVVDHHDHPRISSHSNSSPRRAGRRQPPPVPSISDSFLPLSPAPARAEEVLYPAQVPVQRRLLKHLATAQITHLQPSESFNTFKPPWVVHHFISNSWLAVTHWQPRSDTASACRALLCRRCKRFFPKEDSPPISEPSARFEGTSPEISDSPANPWKLPIARDERSNLHPQDLKPGKNAGMVNLCLLTQTS